LILSCTHYPFIRREIEKALGDGVHVIDPAEETAKNTIDLLEKQGLSKRNGQGSTTIYFTADLDRGMRLAKRMLPNTKSIFAQINLK